MKIVDLKLHFFIILYLGASLRGDHFEVLFGDVGWLNRKVDCAEASCDGLVGVGGLLVGGSKYFW